MGYIGSSALMRVARLLPTLLFLVLGFAGLVVKNEGLAWFGFVAAFGAFITLEYLKSR